LLVIVSGITAMNVVKALLGYCFRHVEDIRIL